MQQGYRPASGAGQSSIVRRTMNGGNSHFCSATRTGETYTVRGVQCDTLSSLLLLAGIVHLYAISFAHFVRKSQGFSFIEAKRGATLCCVMGKKQHLQRHAGTTVDG